MFGEKIINKKIEIILIGIGIIILLGVIGGGYYWWTGTPEYSINQIKKAIETQNEELGLKYVDVDSIFEYLWKDKINNLTEKALANTEENYDILGIQLMKASEDYVKQGLEEGIKSWFTFTPEEIKEETFQKDVSIGIIFQKDFKLKKKNDSVYMIEYYNGERNFILTKKEGEKHWVITKIEILAKD